MTNDMKGKITETLRTHQVGNYTHIEHFAKFLCKSITPFAMAFHTEDFVRFCHPLLSGSEVIKNTKVGQGLKFLPRKLTDLVKSLQVLLEELAETGKTDVRNKVAAT